MSSSATPANQVTSGNVGPAINVVTWFLAATAVISVIARMVTKKILSRLWLDDVFIVAALIPSVAMSVSVGFQTANGLGQHRDTLSPQQLDGFQKSTYASDLLYIPVLLLSKISILCFFQMLTPVPLHRNIVKGLMAVVSVWGLSAFLVAAFQCHAPTTWTFLDKSQCISRAGFWMYFCISNLVLELAIVIFPIIVVSRLQANAGSKLLVVSCFVARILVVAVQIAEIVARYQYASSTDGTYDFWPSVICSQLVQSLSIITACIPYLKPFLSSLQTGMIRTDDIRRRAGNKAGYYNQSGYYSASAPSTGLKLDMKMGSAGGKSGRPSLKSPISTSSFPLSGLKSPKYPQSKTTVKPGEGGQWDAQSNASNTMMINKTMEWEVQTERRPSAVEPEDRSSPIGTAM